MHRRATVVVRAIVAIAAASAMVGCEMFGGADGARASSPTSVATPATFAEAAARYNQRVERLDRVWARTTLRVEGVENSGEAIDEQAEGNLQVIRPRRLALTVMKVGEPLFYLGSNEDQFWWLDIRQNRSALVGRHDRATPRSVEEFGVPVLPLDLMDLLAVMPIDPRAAGFVRTNPAGLELFYPTRSGAVAMLLDPRSMEPKIIEIRTTQGRSLLRAELLNYKPVLVPGGGVAPRLPTWYKISVVGTPTRMEIRLYDAENRGDRMRDAPYKLDTLLRVYRIDTVRDVTGAATPPARPGTGGA